MGNTKGLLLWVAGFSGVILVVSAYKNKSLLSTFDAYFSGNPGLDTTSVATPTQITSQATQYADPFNDVNPQVFDNDGLAVNVPSVYANNPSAYIPSTTPGRQAI